MAARAAARSGQGTGRMKAAGSGGFGGIQVDKFGNINMIGIGPHPKLKVRGPGTVGTIWMGSAPSNVYVEHHSKRIFVEKCDYISGPGWLEGGDSRHKLLNGRDGPKYIWSPICVFDFTEDEHRARIASVHPGYTVEGRGRQYRLRAGGAEGRADNHAADRLGTERAAHPGRSQRRPQEAAHDGRELGGRAYELPVDLGGEGWVTRGVQSPNHGHGCAGSSPGDDEERNYDGRRRPWKRSAKPWPIRPAFSRTARR